MKSCAVKAKGDNLTLVKTILRLSNFDNITQLFVKILELAKSYGLSLIHYPFNAIFAVLLFLLCIYMNIIIRYCLV